MTAVDVQANIVLMGAGAHMTSKLIPALLKLQAESRIRFVALVREHPEKGGLAAPLDVVPVHKSIGAFALDSYDTIVASGPPALHLEAIKWATAHKKRVFVEKPHLLSSDDFKSTRSEAGGDDGASSPPLPTNVMIGYNFNFMPFVQDASVAITHISAGTNGIYMSWGPIFPEGTRKVQYALHSVIVHPISVYVQKYGTPDECDIVVSPLDHGDAVEIKIGLKYGDTRRTIDYTSDAKEFFMDITVDSKKGEPYRARDFKTQTYLDQLKFFLCNRAGKIDINGLETGQRVVDLINRLVAKL